VEGAWLFQTVLDQAASGQMTFELTCPHAREPCQTLLMRAQRRPLDSVESCRRGGGDGRCLLATVDALEITIFTSHETPIRDISRVVGQELIIVADELID
jgi:hypothetical protein